MKTLVAFLCAWCSLLSAELTRENRNGDGKTETIILDNFEHFPPVGPGDWGNLPGSNKNKITSSQNNSFINEPVTQRVRGIRKRKVRVIRKKVNQENSFLEATTPFTAFSQFNDFSLSVSSNELNELNPTPTNLSSPLQEFSSISGDFSLLPIKDIKSSTDLSSQNNLTSTSGDLSSQLSDFKPPPSDFISYSSDFSSPLNGFTTSSNNGVEKRFQKSLTIKTENDITNLNAGNSRDIDILNIEIDGATDNDREKDAAVLKEDLQDVTKDNGKLKLEDVDDNAVDLDTIEQDILLSFPASANIQKVQQFSHQLHPNTTQFDALNVEFDALTTATNVMDTSTKQITITTGNLLPIEATTAITPSTGHLSQSTQQGTDTQPFGDDQTEDQVEAAGTAAIVSFRHLGESTEQVIDNQAIEYDEVTEIKPIEDINEPVEDETNVPTLQLVFKADISNLTRQGREQVIGDEVSAIDNPHPTQVKDSAIILNDDTKKDNVREFKNVELTEENLSSRKEMNVLSPLTLELGNITQETDEKTTTVRNPRSTTIFGPEESTPLTALQKVPRDEQDLSDIDALVKNLPVGPGFELEEADKEILKALFELELLRGKQNEMDDDIEEKLEKLDLLVQAKEVEEGIAKVKISDQIVSESSEESDAIEDEKRKPKTFEDSNNKLQEINEVDFEVEVDFFSNIQKQIAALLSERKEFIDNFTAKINSELHIIRQTVTLLQNIVAFKIEQSEVLFGSVSPILEILQHGTLSIFSSLSQFVHVLESVFALKAEFFRSFTSSTSNQRSREVGILERVKDLKLKTILPTKMRIMLNILNNSEELGQIIGMILECVGELLDSKKELVESVGKFVEDKLKFVSTLTGPGVEFNDLLKAAKSGTLLQFLNVGPINFRGSDLPDSQLNEMVGELLYRNNPQVPVLGLPLKELLVDHRSLGALAGFSRGRVVNSLLAARLKTFIQGSSGKLEVRQGEALLEADTPPIQLGERCERELDIGRSRVVVWTKRSSQLHATAGLTAHKGSPPSLDLLATALMDTAMDWNTFFTASFGKNIFGRCFSKFSKVLPLRVLASARSLLNVRVATTNVRLEKRNTTGEPILPFPVPNLNLRAGFLAPHLVFNFHLHLDGKLINLDISSLKLTGCDVKVMGLTMFSFCGLLEKFLLNTVRDATRDNLPLTNPQLLRELEYAIKMKLGEELSIPLVLSDSQDMSPVEKTVNKARKLLDLNLRLINRLTSFNNDLNDVSSQVYTQ